MFTEKEMSDALKWLFDLFQPEDYEAYDEEEVGCAALCLPEVCMALRDKAETAYEYVVKTNIDRGFEYRGKELFMQRACLIYSDIEIGIPAECRPVFLAATPYGYWNRFSAFSE